MTRLSQITHPNEFVQNKVNFFADYFHFAVHQMGLNDNIEIENYLSLIEKSIFQIERNIDNSPNYLDSYFSHPLLKLDNDYFKEYITYRSLSTYLISYSQLNKPSAKINWIRETPLFLEELKKFRKELKRSMLKSAVKSITSYLLCEHNINFHIADLTHYTNLIVSAFLFSGRTKKELNSVSKQLCQGMSKRLPSQKLL